MKIKTTPKPKLSGLYLLTPDITAETEIETLLQSVQQVLSAGVCLLQFRNKSPHYEFKLALAKQLLVLCRASNVPLIVNDEISIAKTIGADGVHLGKDDGTIAVARAELGPNAIIGVSCYNSLALAKQAEQQGANYVAFGRFFPSNTKPDAISAPLELLQQAKSQTKIPIVAIGGINAENAHVLQKVGADMVAVIEGVFAQKNITAAAQKISNFFLTNFDLDKFKLTNLEGHNKQ